MLETGCRTELHVVRHSVGPKVEMRGRRRHLEQHKRMQGPGATMTGDAVLTKTMDEHPGC